jgi:hypothetical protein
MSVKFSDLDVNDQLYIEPHLKSFYDKVTFETRAQWVMKYEQNDYEGFSSFDTRNYMDEEQFEAIKLDLFLHGQNLFKVSKFGSIQLASKKKYTQPRKWISNEVINLRNTNDFEEMRINSEISNILHSEQTIELQEINFISYNRKIALIVNQLTNLDLSLAEDCRDHVDRLVVHFSSPSNMKLQLISDTMDKIKEYFNPLLTPVIGVSINPELSEELISVFLYCKNIGESV